MAKLILTPDIISSFKGLKDLKASGLFSDEMVELMYSVLKAVK